MHRCRQGSSLFGVILVGCAESILLALKPTQNSKPPGSVQMRPLVHTVRVRASREQRKAAPEERMGGIDGLDFRRVVYQWIVDRGTA